MYLELPKKLKSLGDMAINLSTEMLRPISRKYDLAEHDYPTELDLVASMLDGMNDGDSGAGVGADQSKQKKADSGSVRNGANMAAVVGIQGFCWGDVGLLLTLPRQGLGNAAIGAVANEEQSKRFAGKWAAMAITEPSTLILTAVISADNLSGGLATAAFIAWLSSLTNTAYTATQYALFSSLMTLLAKFISGFAGVVVDGYGYFLFFLYAGILGIPAVLLCLWLLYNPTQAAEENTNKTNS